MRITISVAIACVAFLASTIVFTATHQKQPPAVAPALVPSEAGGLQPPQFHQAPPIMGVFAAATLKPASSLTRYAPPVRDQVDRKNNVQIGDCIENASSNALYTQRVLLGHRPAKNFSVMFPYVQIAGVNNPYAGSSYTDAFRLLETEGAVPDNRYHGGYRGAMYDYRHLPNASDYKHDQGKAIDGYRNLWSTYPYGGGLASEGSLKQAISSGHVVMLGLIVTENFYNYKGIGTISAGGYHFYFLHGVAAYAYDSHGVYVLNSWGKYWGRKGWGVLSWKAFDQMVEEAWVYTKVRS